MIESQKARRRVANLVIHIVLIGLLAVFMGPFFWLLSTSFKTENEMFQIGTTE